MLNKLFSLLPGFNCSIHVYTYIVSAGPARGVHCAGASMGFVVSIGSPSGGTGEPSGTTVDKKKAKAEAAAKKKNLELLKTDPPRYNVHVYMHTCM